MEENGTQCYAVHSAICSFGSLVLPSVVHVRWVARRFRQFRKRDWAYELLVTWLIAVSLWHGIRHGPVSDTELRGISLWLRWALALAAVVVAVAGSWWLGRPSRTPETAEATR